MLDRVRQLPVRAGIRLARQTGLLHAMTAPGLRALVRILASGSQNPSQLYRLHARNTPDRPAIVFQGRTRTWRQVDARIDSFASAFERRGIGRGKSLLLMMKNRPEHIEIAAALARIGAAAVAISSRSTAKELAFLAESSGAIGIAIDRELVAVLDEARSELPARLLANVFVEGESLEALALESPRPLARGVSDDDAAFVVYTSGTTGKPKGAVRKFPKSTLDAAIRFVNETPMRVEDVHLVACPLYHATAFGFTSLASLLGNTIVIMEEFRAETFCELVRRHRVTTTAVVPTMLQRILDLPDPGDLGSLRIVFSGGAPLPGPLALAFMDRFGDRLFNFYGATETGLVTLATPADLRAAPGTIGRALPGNEIRLLDDERHDTRGVGELFVKNALLVSGYHRDDASTRASMVDGFFSVGDLARRDAAGRYFLEGRKRDMIISGGVNVYPAEVEGVLEQHPAIAEIAVVGVPDREWGERVRAFVVRKSGATVTDADLRTWARARLGGPKVPRDWIFVDQLPRNPTGKVLKRELRAVAVE